jgi:hypothetical protein
VVDSQGNPIPFGNEVEIGFFPSTFDVPGNVGQGYGVLQNLEANWTEFGSTTFTSFFPDNAKGEFAGDSIRNPGETMFNNQHIFMWIFKTSDGLPPVTTGPNAFSTVQYWGLFGSSAASWFFPSSLAPFNSPVNITTQDIDLANVFYGGLNASSLVLAPVPEPTGLALFGLGLAVVLGRRSRR